MNKPFKRDEDDDLVCAECGCQVRNMRIETHATIGVEWMQDNEFECIDWVYKNTELICLCGKKMPPESYDWEYEDWWVLRIKDEAIVTGKGEGEVKNEKRGG